jgi:hypothetical protein
VASCWRKPNPCATGKRGWKDIARAAFPCDLNFREDLFYVVG